MWLGNRAGTIHFSTVLIIGQIIIMLCTVHGFQYNSFITSLSLAYGYLHYWLYVALYDNQITKARHCDASGNRSLLSVHKFLQNKKCFWLAPMMGF